MNKKFLGIFAALLVAGSASTLFANAAIGLQGGWNVGHGPGGAITFKVDSLPCVFAVDGYWWNDNLGLGITADWWIQNPRLVGLLHYYYGLGVGGGFDIHANQLTDVYIYGRLLAGLNIFVIDPLELYLQAAFTPGIQIGLREGYGTGFYWGVPVNFGFRVWF